MRSPLSFIAAKLESDSKPSHKSSRSISDMFLTFTNTALLIGLAGAAIPLVLHLLSRTRYQTVDWGAMVFLQGLEGRPQYSARLNQILLLATRMAMVGLVALALAQPVLQHWSIHAFGDEALRAADRGQ